MPLRAFVFVLLTFALLGAGLASTPAATGGGGRPGAGASLKGSAASRAQGRAQKRVVRRVLRRLRRTQPRVVRPGAPGADATSPAPSPAPNPASPPPLGSTDRFGISPDNIEFEEPPVRDRLLDSMVAAGARWIRF